MKKNNKKISNLYIAFSEYGSGYDITFSNNKTYYNSNVTEAELKQLKKDIDYALKRKKIVEKVRAYRKKLEKGSK